MARKIQIIPLGNVSEWNESLIDIPHSFTHTHEYCEAIYITKNQNTFLFVYENEGIKIVCPLTERSFSGYVDITKTNGISGFTGNGFHRDFYDAWEDFIFKKNYVTGYLSLYPLFSDTSIFPVSDQYHNINMFLLDISVSLESMLTRMSRNRKREFRKWQEISDTLVIEKKQLFNFYKDHYKTFLESKNASKHYYFSPATLRYLFKSDNVFGVGITRNHRMVAAIIFARSPYAGDALMYCALPGENHDASLMYWDGIIKLKKAGIPVFNFGGAINNGLINFKKRFGTIQKPLIAVKQIYNIDMYRKLCKESKINPDNLSGYFPPYHKKTR
jgi:hypothetical protein